MARSGGISGIGVAVATAGGFLLYAGIRDVNLLTGLREIVGGKTPTPTPPKPSILDKVVPEAIHGFDPAARVSRGDAIATAARAQLGKPYVWGTAGPNTFDCSGLAVYALRQSGVSVPPNVRRVRDFVRWDGTYGVPRTDTKPGDLVCWDFVHMGIAVSHDRMIHAPLPGTSVSEVGIWSVPPPVIRRVK